MTQILSVPFQFRGKEYYSLVRFIPKDGCTHVRVTIMNGSLEQLLMGKGTFEYKNGYLIADLPQNECPQRELQLEILNALKNYVIEDRTKH